MAKPGEQISSPVNEALTFLKTTAQTKGALLEVEAVYKNDALPPPAHYHPHQEERFLIIRGVFRARVGPHEATYQAGDEIVVPPGVAHWLCRVSGDDAAAIWQIRPALNTETFYETLWGLARAGRTNYRGEPGLLDSALIGQAYSAEFRLSRPPYLLQKLFFILVAPIARLLKPRAWKELKP